MDWDYLKLKKSSFPENIAKKVRLYEMIYSSKFFISALPPLFIFKNFGFRLNVNSGAADFITLYFMSQLINYSIKKYISSKGEDVKISNSNYL